MMLYPLKFRPRFVPKMWGGRKLETVLNKAIPPVVAVGESWELYDFPPGVVEGSGDWVSAAVANGPLAGRTLHELVSEYGADLLGDAPLSGAGQFPLLIKFLDAREVLSVQVHPDEAYCREHPEAHLKSEAWYVLQSDPGAVIYKGLKQGVTAERFRAELGSGRVEELIAAVPVKPGDCHYLPSGTLHALGAGILVAEVQTPSDTTFRAYDFNRVDPTTGLRRQLHIEQAMACIDFSGNDGSKQTRSHSAGFFTTVTRLCSTPYFTIEKVRFIEGAQEPVPYDQPVVWIMLEGEAELRVDGAGEATGLKAGETVLLPAKMRNPVLKTLKDCVWLEVTVRGRSDEVRQGGATKG
jgi:mannose-6-phosphate isomerase